MTDTEPTYPIFDADNLPHFPCGDNCHLCVDGQPICWDCQTLWPCATAAEILVSS